MQPASISQIKDELKEQPASRLVEYCLQLAKYKKDNKELLSYLLFESHDPQGYTEAVKKEITADFGAINSSNLYFAKKSIRKILRIANKHIRYAASKEAEADLLLHFCATLRSSGIPFEKSTALNNLYLAQLKKIEKVISSMHEDLQYDYRKELERLL